MKMTALTGGIPVDQLIKTAFAFSGTTFLIKKCKFLLVKLLEKFIPGNLLKCFFSGRL